MIDIEIVLPYPPSVNHYWQSKAVKSRKTQRWTVIKFLSKRAKEFREQVTGAVHDQLEAPPRLRGRLAVIVHQYYGGRSEDNEYSGQAQDIDNCIKPLLDALENSKVFVNDSQVDELLVTKKRRAAIGRVEVTIKTIG
jgi:crossover junction endodeoxyribonuclease RusA